MDKYKQKLIHALSDINTDGEVVRWIERNFPELRESESEDERIRRELVAFFKKIRDSLCGLYWNGLEVDGIIAYLEKQKEQIPYIDFVIKPHKGDDNNPYDMRVSEAQEYAIKRGFDIPFNDGEVYVDERHLTQTIGNILRWADEHPKEQKEKKTDAKSERVIKAARRVLNNWLDGTDCPDVSGDFAELEYAILEYDGEEKLKEHFRDSTKMVDKGLEEVAVDQARSLGYQKEDYEYKELVETFIAGAKWQEKHDEETIKTAEDHAFLAGANWQKEQMMEEAVEGEIVDSAFDDGTAILKAIVPDRRYDSGDKVKLIVIKED